MVKKTQTPNGLDSPGKGGAYFLALKLANIRCFGSGEQMLDLSDGNGHPARWTVLLGNNGTGKTTLLQCLAEFDSGPDGRPGGISREQSTHLRTIGSVDEARLDVMTSYQSMRNGKSAAGTVMVSLAVSDKWRAHPLPLNPDLERRLPLCFGYGASRRAGPTVLTRGEERVGGWIDSLFDDQADLRNAEEWLLQLDYGASKPSEIKEAQRKRLEQARALLIDVLPDVEDIRISPGSHDHPQPVVEFQTPDGWVPLSWVGYGYRTTVAWLVDFMSRMVEHYPESADPLSEPAVVLVDEIDLHLHPKWQRSLMEYLGDRFPNTQFIVTAHSPLFVQSAADANLVVLRRDPDKGHVVIDNDVKAIANWRVDQVLTSDLFGLDSARPKSLDPLLSERKRLLTQSSMSDADRERLKELETQIGSLPTGETSREIETASLLEKTLRVLQKSTGSSE